MSGAIHIYQPGGGDNPLVIYEFEDMAEYLVSIDIPEVRGTEPMEGEASMYEMYQSRWLQHELGKLELSD